MSSTNRSNTRLEHIADYYVTPVDDIKLFINKLNNVEDIDWIHSIILDPCAGGNSKTEYNAYHPMSYPKAINDLYPDANIRTMDIREDSFADTKCDYLTYELEYKPNIIITNPPFNKAIDIINKALKDIEDNGYVIMLLRLNFFGSEERFEFFKKHMPKYCFVHHKRISFTDRKDSDGKTLYKNDGTPKRGSTDSIEYCHMVFTKDNLNYTKTFVI